MKCPKLFRVDGQCRCSSANDRRTKSKKKPQTPHTNNISTMEVRCGGRIVSRFAAPSEFGWFRTKSIWHSALCPGLQYIPSNRALLLTCICCGPSRVFCASRRQDTGPYYIIYIYLINIGSTRDFAHQRRDACWTGHAFEWRPCHRLDGIPGDVDVAVSYSHRFGCQLNARPGRERDTRATQRRRRRRRKATRQHKSDGIESSFWC